VFGPAPAFLTRLRGMYRYRVLVKSPGMRLVQPEIRAALKAVRVPAAVRVKVDIDPYNFL